MKSGLDLNQMAVELERRNNAKRDFVADTRSLVLDNTAHLKLNLPTSKSIDLLPGETFRRQAATHYKVPQDYAERIRETYPALYAQTFNTHMQGSPTRRMVRTLDGNARAFLSDRYRPLDDYDLANAILPEIFRQPEMRLESSQFTESRFYLKAVFPKIQAEVKKGDVVQIGLVVSNSEVGAGAMQVMPMVYRLVCLNGMISPDYGQRRYHVGKRASEEESAYELYSDDTKRLDDATFYAKVRDTVKGILTHGVLEALTDKLREASQQKIEGVHIQNVIEVTAKRFAYGENTKAGLLRHLIEGGDLTRYGLMNAITRQSQDEPLYEIATRMEMDGSRIIELPREDWKQIAESALQKAA